MNKPWKAAQLIEYLEERLVSGHFGSGGKIPSVRRLSDKFGISYGTALNGIDYLCSHGRLEKIAKRGIFVKNQQSRNTMPDFKRIAVFLRPETVDAHSGMFYTAFHGMQEIAFNSNFNFLVNQLPAEKASPELFVKLSEGAEGVIFLCEYDLNIHNMDLRKVVVGVLMDNSFGGTISTVNMDPWSAAKIAVDYFEERQVKTVEIFSSIMPAYMTRGEMFAALWRKKGGLVKWLSEKDKISFDRNHGYLFTSDHRAQDHSQDYLKANGRFLAEDHIILGMDGKQLIDPDFHRFPSIVVNWKIIGELAFQECFNRINNPNLPPKNITLCGKLYIPGKGFNNI